MTPQSVKIVKLGGSLLAWPELLTRWQAWWGQQQPARWLLLVGGGTAADGVRQAHALHPIDQTAAHWLCVRAMQLNAELVAQWLAWPLGSTASDWQAAWQKSPGIVLEPWHWLTRVEPWLPGLRLPCRWSATSDSIAARLAQAAGAEELVLLKSTLPAAAQDAESAAACDLVDREFPVFAAGLAVRVVNLRAQSDGERNWPAAAARG